jgi:F-type H+-transporting ATPase subunit epsilon
MAKHVPFKLITPASVAFDGEAELVIVTGTEGEVGILPSHAPYLTALKPGVLRANIVGEGGGTKRLELATSGGFLQALPDRIVVLVDQAIAADKIDSAAAKTELDEASERQKSAGSDQAVYAREQERIDFANAKLALVAR